MRCSVPASLAAVASVALGGCAATNFSIRSLPPETPAADNAAAAAVPGINSANDAGRAAEAGHGPGGQANPDAQAAPLLTAADAPPLYTYDPWERVNRFTYRFNARFDEAVFLPVSNGYRRLPSPIRSGVHNFFANLSEVPTVVNYGLQLRFPPGVRSLGRFVINSTLGLGGLLDVATKLKLKGAPTGFSATLSTWGMHPGPYLVLPLLGPSTLRDGVGYLADYGISHVINVVDLYRGNKTWGLYVVSATDERANTSFRYYATGSPFEYETIRFLYVRKELIEDEALHRSLRRKDRDSNAPAGR